MASPSSPRPADVIEAWSLSQAREFGFSDIYPLVKKKKVEGLCCRTRQMCTPTSMALQDDHTVY
jgi:hypothetical protein